MSSRWMSTLLDSTLGTGSLEGILKSTINFQSAFFPPWCASVKDIYDSALKECLGIVYVAVDVLRGMVAQNSDRDGVDDRAHLIPRVDVLASQTMTIFPSKRREGCYLLSTMVLIFRCMYMLVPKHANCQYRYGAAHYWYWYPYSNLLGTTNMLEWVHTTYKQQNDLLCACMHRNQHC
jgi:hypothetical protein